MSNIKIDWSEAPNWGNAPEWANWTAQNKDGNWNWFEAEPELYDYRFIPVDFTKHQFALRSENTDGWETSLEKKPNEVVVEFFDELCDDDIDWNEAPEWANWVAQNPNCCWYWLEHKPSPNIDENIWDVKSSSGVIIYKQTAPTKDWKHTLQERPKPKLEPKTPRFESAIVGDRAYSTKVGWGEIINVDMTSVTPLRFKADNENIEKLYYYDLYGHSNPNHEESVMPELYWDVPTITGGDTPPECMASIGGYEYPQPLNYYPKPGATVYYAAINGLTPSYVCTTWENSLGQIKLLEAGYIQKSSDGAIKHSEAMIMALKNCLYLENNNES